MDYYLAGKTNKTLSFMISWKELVDIVLTEISHKNQDHIFSHICMLKKLTCMKNGDH